jgi:predicted transcriptional regulator
MSLEKKRETKEKNTERELEGSSFRRLDFTPLQDHKVKKKKKVKAREKPVTELSDIEQDVLIIAQEILKLKRYDADFDIDVSSEAELQKFPIIEKLYAKSIAKLAYKKGYSKEEIFLSIRSLEEKNWIVTNERRTKLEILNNEKLVKILKFIEENPGIHARNSKIEEELEITRTPFLKHIMTLERFKLIRSKKIGKSLHYFLVDVPEDYDKYKVIFSNPLIPKIIEQIFKDEGIAISKIGEVLDVYSGTIQYYMKKLKDLDLIKSVKTQKDEKILVINVELLVKFNDFFDEPDFSILLKGL